MKISFSHFVTLIIDLFLLIYTHSGMNYPPLYKITSVAVERSPSPSPSTPDVTHDSRFLSLFHPSPTLLTTPSSLLRLLTSASPSPLLTPSLLSSTLSSTLSTLLATGNYNVATAKVKAPNPNRPHELQAVFTLAEKGPLFLRTNAGINPNTADITENFSSDRGSDRDAGSIGKGKGRSTTGETNLLIAWASFFCFLRF